MLGNIVLLSIFIKPQRKNIAGASQHYKVTPQVVPTQTQSDCTAWLVACFMLRCSLHNKWQATNHTLVQTPQCYSHTRLLKHSVATLTPKPAMYWCRTKVPKTLPEVNSQGESCMTFICYNQLITIVFICDSFWHSLSVSPRCTQRVQRAWLLLGLAIESPWSALGGPFLSSFAQMGLENSLLAM